MPLVLGNNLRIGIRENLAVPWILSEFFSVRERGKQSEIIV